MPTQPRVQRTSTSVWVGVFAFLVIGASLLGGCRRDPGTGQVSPTPSPSPQESPTGPQEGSTEQRADTPIVVKGGGSIDLEFDEGVFKGEKTPACTNCKIKSVTLEQIKNTGAPIPTTHSPQPCGTGEIENVRIRSKNNATDITVKKVGDGVEIEPINYGAVVNECGEERKHHSHLGEIRGVSVNSNPQECGGCGGNPKRCRIVITVDYARPR